MLYAIQSRMTEWITIEHFVEVLKRSGFTVTEEAGWLIVSREEWLDPYKIREDRRVPPKTFTRYAYKFNIDIKEFVPPRLMR